jgi:type II restriction enzyme
MELKFNTKLAERFKSPSQKARVLTEDWVDRQVYCPNCGRLDIDKYENNKPVADFFCVNCREDYELKSKKDAIGTKIVDGEYDAMIKRLRSSSNPNFFMMSYSPQSFEVVNFFVIPKYFFVPAIIEKRKPLSPNAERADWVGCNILLRTIPESGKIFFVKNKIITPKEKVVAGWKKILFLREEREILAKGWLLDVMRCVEKLDKKEFILDDIYRFEKQLSYLHPDNKHIKDKIRQQLQILRDKGYLDFKGRGIYHIT